MATELGTLDRDLTADGAAPNPLREGLDSNRISDPCSIVFFGASGDLVKRMLMPAMYNLRLGDVLPTNFAIVGFSRSEMTPEQFRDDMKKAVDEFSRSGPARDPLWTDFANHISYIAGDFDDAAAFRQLRAQLEENDRTLGTAGNRLYLPFDAAFRFHQDHPAAQQRGPRAERSGSRLVAHHHREAVRYRPRVGARLAGRSHEGLRRKARLSHRSLPRQRTGAGHHGAALRQHDLRADLEPALRRLRADHGGRNGRRRRPRRLLRQRRARCAT